jgi:thiamine biosynthesis lipoprotein
VATSLSWRALGTTAGVHVTDPSRLALAGEVLAAELHAIDSACSRFRADSELARLNAARGDAFSASDLLLEAVSVALRAARVSGGAVDPTVGRALRAIGYDRDFDEIAATRTTARLRVESVAGWRVVRLDRERRTIRVPDGVELDLGATAKALAADRAAARAHAAAGCGVLVNLGGDVAMAGEPPEGGWTVLVTDDHSSGPDADGETVRLFDGGLATSSTSVRRWATSGGASHHIVDPTTGLSARETWRTVSVAAGSCVDANVATTTSIVRGEPATGWLEALGLPGRLVRPAGAVVRVGAWPEAPT